MKHPFTNFTTYITKNKQACHFLPISVSPGRCCFGFSAPHPVSCDHTRSRRPDADSPGPVGSAPSQAPGDWPADAVTARSGGGRGQSASSTPARSVFCLQNINKYNHQHTNFTNLLFMFLEYFYFDVPVIKGTCTP